MRKFQHARYDYEVGLIYLVFGLPRCLNSLHLFWLSQCTLYLENFWRLANFMKYFFTTERILNPNPRIRINSKPAHHIFFFFESFLLIKNDVAEKSFRKWIFVSSLFLSYCDVTMTIKNEWKDHMIYIPSCQTVYHPKILPREFDTVYICSCIWSWMIHSFFVFYETHIIYSIVCPRVLSKLYEL